MPNLERIKSVGFGIERSGDKFQEIHFSRRPLGHKDILIDILYAGICHSDLHTVRQHWGDVKFPIIPGHEILGVVKEKGDQVSKFEIGDYVGVGCMVDSCGECCACNNDREQECEDSVLTYGSIDKKHNNEYTQGGYSTNYVLNENFGIKINPKANMKKVPSLMCAGITVFSPIHEANVEEGMICGVLGLGGLGHMAVQYLNALGCTVIAFDKEDKEDFAKKLNCKFVQVENDDVDESFFKKFDFIISTIPYEYNINTYLKLSKPGSNFVIVGLPPYDECPQVSIKDMILNYPSVKIWGSMIGGIKETQLCADFSIANDIYPIVEEIEPTIDDINMAYGQMYSGKIDGRFVINMKNFHNKK